MTEQASSGDGQGVTFTLLGNLSPADASERREELLEALKTAQTRKSQLVINMDADPSPCALQLLIACDRSAKRAGVDIALIDRANSALEGINLN